MTTADTTLPDLDDWPESAPLPPWRKTEEFKREQMLDQGFTGTLQEFVGWLNLIQIGGFVAVGEPEADRWGREHRKVELVTGGHSVAEHVFSRAYSSLMWRRFWESSARGGLYVYEVPEKAWQDTEKVIEWVTPDTGVFEQVHHARYVELIDEHGNTFSAQMPHGASLSFRSPFDRDTFHDEPAGTLIIRPITEHHSIWASLRPLDTEGEAADA